MSNKDWLSIDLGTWACRAGRLGSEGLKLVPISSAPEESPFLMPAGAYVSRGKHPKILTGHTAASYRTGDPERFLAEPIAELIDPRPVLPGCSYHHADLVTAMLAAIREDAARDNDGVFIDKAVIAVPGAYPEKGPHWRGIWAAALTAGFRQVTLIPAPLAAVMDHDHANGESSRGLILVYDFGAGFTPTLVEVTGVRRILPGLGGSGSTPRGGAHLDSLLVKHLLDKCPSVASRVVSDTGTRLEMLEFCRQLKHDLDQREETVGTYKKMEFRLTRHEMHTILAPLIRQSISVCEQLLKTNHKSWRDLARIIPVGGCCRMPLVNNMLTAYLKQVGAPQTEVAVRSWPNGQGADPLYAVCSGAALAKLEEEESIMNPKVYEQKRNELIQLLESVLAIKSVPQEPRERIQGIRDKSVSNQFEVALIGEFQGGKSTTFNTICDGREISPRGAMVKTSACKISAQNLVDPNAEEYAAITWRSDEELLLGMVSLLEPQLKEIEQERFYEATQEQMVFGHNDDLGGDILKEGSKIRPLDLANPEDNKLLQEALRKEWEKFKKAPHDYEALDVLRISSIIAHFQGNPKIAGLRERNRISIQELGRLVTFPMEWELRWQGYSPQKFHAEEVVFAFIAGVRCHIHSPNLARLGCVITDCPGLFASHWDTHVALQAMFDADAILYLMGGERAMTQGDLKALEIIRLSKMGHKLFYGMNVKGNLNNVKTRIRPENAARLNNHSFAVEEQEIHLYHALLGLCAVNGEAFLTGNMDDNSQREFIRIAQMIDPQFSSEFDQTWILLARSCLMRLDHFSKGVSALNDESLQIVKEASELDRLMDAIERAVIGKKAHAILVSGGAEKARLVLEEVEGTLKAKETTARKTEKEFLEAKVKAREELKQFQKKVKEIIGNLEQESLGGLLAENFENEVILERIPEITNVAMVGINKNILTLTSLIKNLIGFLRRKLMGEQKEGLEAVLKPIVEDAINQVCGVAAQGWLENIKKGDSQVYEATIGKEVRDVSQKIKQTWNEIFGSSGTDKFAGLLDGLEIESPVGTLVSNEALFQAIDTSELSNEIQGAGGIIIAGNLVGLAVGGAAGYGTFLGLAAVIFSGVGIVPLIVSLISSYFVAIWTGERILEFAKDKARAKAEKKVREGLVSALHERKAKETLRKSSLKIIFRIQKLFVLYFKDRLEKQKNQFENRVRDASMDFEKSNAERKKLAEKLHHIRIEEIEPVRRRIEEYLGKIKPLFPKGTSELPSQELVKEA